MIENAPNWVMPVAVLVAALLMYFVAWKIVEGTHLVVRAATRILLGALIAVPAILFFVYGQTESMSDRMTSRSPPAESRIEKSADREPAKEAASETAEATKSAGTPSKEAAASPPSSAATPDEPSRPSEPTSSEPSTIAPSGGEPARDEAVEVAASERDSELTEVPAAESEEMAVDEAAPGGGGGFREGFTGKKREERHYRRSYEYSPPAAANGGSGTDTAARDSLPDLSGAGEGGGGTGRSIGSDDFKSSGGFGNAASPDTSPGSGTSGSEGNALDSGANRGVPEMKMEAAPPEALREIPDAAAMRDVSPTEVPRSAEASPAESTAASEVKEDWSIVPVYYGTDRARADSNDRIGYDWQRGRNLLMGVAMVTIPKLHEVPMVERPWALKIPYVDIVLYEAAEDPKKHFTMKELKQLPKEEFLRLVKERLEKSARFKDHALVFIHGYKTKFDNAVYRTAQIAYDLKFDGAPFLYSWPSGGTLQGYTYDRESAGQSELYLRQFLEMVRDETGAKKVSIIAHSMGNQLLLRTLQDMKRTMPEGVQISQLILAAPDVDRDSFQNIVKSIEGIAEGITLYAASNDAALAFSRRVNGGIPRAGDVPEGGPIVMQELDTIDATATSMDSVGINHSGYAENNALLDDIGRLVAAGVRPPDVRLPKLERIETDKGAYWRYPETAK